ncbi:hypothetical protein LZZ85_11515 [Terrimonas sp. NA20]|uniref:Lipoprotein n=1 Tax=Terrimonas ginsenosidimutans TaxID=2908004 RepID=A0ABS9KRF3_9BACT|nr:hypothetical protein [Terrimonas ginsenosidimutans]MCG2614917.1 hypothetical protein [Terrimonas ginsenosidimutans]
MKQLTIFIALATLLASCAGTKNVSTTKSSTDSLAAKSLQGVSVKKKDSLSAQVDSSNKKKSVDSNYKKTTTVKEYFAVGSEFEDDVSAGDKYYLTPSNPSTEFDYLPIPKTYFPFKGFTGNRSFLFGDGLLLFRETTTTEEGRLISEEEMRQSRSGLSDLKTNDSSAVTKSDTTRVVKNEVTKSKEVKHGDLFRILGLIVFILILLYICYRIYTYKSKKTIR